MPLRTFQAYLDDENLITIELAKNPDAYAIQFTLEDRHSASPLTIRNINNQDSRIIYSVSANEPIDLTKAYQVYDQDRNCAVLQYRHIVQKPIFDELFAYSGSDLGAHYSSEATLFKLWAPISEQVLLRIKEQVCPLVRGERGVWQTELSGDWEGAAYSYLHKVNGRWIEVHDPYALSSEANSGASYVIDLEKIKRPIERARSQIELTAAVIYEMSVRDFSKQKEAGFRYPGTFRALSQSPEKEGQRFGLAYLQNLGITHVQLMPLYDFGSVDEKHPDLVYNWGYDPVQYNLPDGSFASDPDDPYARILELQEAVAAYHRADISVIMDVVYNHVYDADSFSFEKIVPGYFFRLDPYGFRTNGSFCGNDVASERAMVRSYIKQSLRQWVTLYGFDGFRFDLMGLLDTKTMQEIAEELKALYPGIALYGEGWQMATGLDSELLAHQYKAAQLPDYGFFSDHFRDSIKTTISSGQRLETDNPAARLENVLTANVGLIGPPHFTQPHQAINYTECHDNATVFDYFDLANPETSLRERLAKARLALQLVLLAQGVPFIHSGQECYRTKNLIDNSYNQPDSINQLDWLRSLRYQEEIGFVRDLIAFRKAHPLLRLTSSAAIREACQVSWLSPSLAEYRLADGSSALTIVINFASHEARYSGPEDQLLAVAYPQVGLSAPLASPQTDYQLAGQQLLVFKDPNL